VIYKLFVLSAFLKKISQKTSYTTFGKPFTPIQKSPEFLATNTGSAIRKIVNNFLLAFE